VVGWNEGEFAMFGVTQREHEERYAYAQEWIDVIKMIWSDKEDFDFLLLNQLLDGVHGDVDVAHERGGHQRKQRDRDEILERIVGELADKGTGSSPAFRRSP
jgi:alkanesulfonate monooxygenase SsuD/methylene tetrahydromethanopterin reductase-like flavin-dependent oxidoreductase (luciferase family)